MNLQCILTRNTKQIRQEVSIGGLYQLCVGLLCVSKFFCSHFLFIFVSVVGIMALVGYGGWKLVEVGWIEPSRGNLTEAEYILQNILGERCDSIGGAVPWKQLRRNIMKCKRHEYYDPLHDDCALCPVRKETDKVFAVYWETHKDCMRVRR